MHHEHLVAVNDPSSPLSYQVSRRQLWQGLMLRAEEPGYFLPGVDSVTLLERSATHLQREMQLGKLRVRDRIEFVEQESICYHTEAGEAHGGGTLTISIEEPEDGFLTVRFIYDTVQEVRPEEAYLLDYLKKAYTDLDVDCIRTIRSWAEDGKLG